RSVGEQSAAGAAHRASHPLHRLVHGAEGFGAFVGLHAKADRNEYHGPPSPACATCLPCPRRQDPRLAQVASRKAARPTIPRGGRRVGRGAESEWRPPPPAL